MAGLARVCAGWALLIALSSLGSGCGTRVVESRPLFTVQQRDPAGKTELERQHLYRQVVDPPEALEECAILEGAAYKYLLRVVSHFTEEELYQRRDRTADYERLRDHPNLFRGHVYAVEQCVAIEVERAELSSEYGPELEGYEVLLALVSNKVHELYELRILVPSGSELFGRLKSGIEKGQNPVLRVSGIFLKCHAKRDSTQEIWREPLLVCPAPRFNRAGMTHDAGQDLIDAKMAHLLPSQRIDAPKAEERLVVEILPGKPSDPGRAGPAKLRVDRVHSGAVEDGELLRRGLEGLQKRLPAAEAAHPSAVVILTAGAPRACVAKVVQLLRGAGLERVYFKDEQERPVLGIGPQGGVLEPLR